MQSNVHSAWYSGKMIVQYSRLIVSGSDGNIQLQKRKGYTEMTYTKIRLYTSNGIPEALSNLWYGTECSVVEIRDAVEDAKDGRDLLGRLKQMHLLRRIHADRENDKRVRFKTIDFMGNISYLEIIR